MSHHGETLLMSLPLLLLLVPLDAMKVFSTTQDYDLWANSTGVGASLRSANLSGRLVDLTLCLRFYEFVITDGFLVESGNLLRMQHKPREDGRSKYLRFLTYSGFYESVWSPRRWHHVCLSFEGSTGRLVMVTNGQVVLDIIAGPLDTELLHQDVLGNLNIMRTGQSPSLSLFGKMADVNVWSSFHEPSADLMAWSLCQSTMGQGDLVTWGSGEWRTSLLLEEDLEEDTLCKEGQPGLSLLPLGRSLQESVDVCSKFGGRLGVADSMDTYQQMTSILRSNLAVCPGQQVYSGYTDQVREGRWVDVIMGYPLPPVGLKT